MRTTHIDSTSMVYAQSFHANMKKSGFFVGLLLACLLWHQSPAHAQFSPLATQPLYGAYAHWISAVHTANFHALAGTSLSQDNTAFTTGSGRGSAIGIATNIPFSAAFSNAVIASRVHLGLRIGYHQYDGTLQAQRDTAVLYHGRPAQGLVQHTVDASLASVEIEPLLGFSPFGGLQFHIGGEVSIPLSTSFIHRQKFIRPAQITTRDELYAGEDEHGDITDVPSVRIATLLGISYAFPLDTKDRLFFIPEVFVSIPISHVSQSVDWSVSTVRAGVQVLYTPVARETPQRDTVIHRDTVESISPHTQRERVYFADANISIQTERNSKREIVLIREQYIRERPAPPRPLAPRVTWAASTQEQHSLLQQRPVYIHASTAQYSVPLLPFVFFDSASAQLPHRYNQLRARETGQFAALPVSTLPVAHCDILNIVGRKLRADNHLNIVLTGCTDGIAEPLALAEQRAHYVRSYLLTTWGIAPTRVQVQARVLPAHPSNDATPEGTAENRRVELSFGSGEAILQTVLEQRYFTVPAQTVILQLAAADTVASWKLVLAQSGSELYQRGGTGALPDTLVWHPDSTLARNNIAAITCALSVYSANDGREESDTALIDVSLLSAAPVLHTDKSYPLLLFPFGETTLSAQQKAHLRQSAYTSLDNLVVIGSTDNIGDTQLNRSLSLARAKVVASALGLPAARARGLGEDGALYDNALPEGRFYNRMVRVEQQK